MKNFKKVKNSMTSNLTFKMFKIYKKNSYYFWFNYYNGNKMLILKYVYINLQKFFSINYEKLLLSKSFKYFCLLQSFI